MTKLSSAVRLSNKRVTFKWLTILIFGVKDGQVTTTNSVDRCLEMDICLFFKNVSNNCTSQATVRHMFCSITV
jgi:hypothetical protein